VKWLADVAVNATDSVTFLVGIQVYLSTTIPRLKRPFSVCVISDLVQVNSTALSHNCHHPVKQKPDTGCPISN